MFVSASVGEGQLVVFLTISTRLSINATSAELYIPWSQLPFILSAAWVLSARQHSTHYFEPSLKQLRHICGLNSP